MKTGAKVPSSTATASGAAPAPAPVQASGLATITHAAQLIRLCIPRVVSLIVFTAVIGIFLTVPSLPRERARLLGSPGIALVAEGETE